MDSHKLETSVIIIGAGPSGAGTSFFLTKEGIPHIVLEKETFPRDKVCGDAIPGRAIKTLKSIDPAFGEAFNAFPQKFETKSTAIFYKGKQLTFHWAGDSYTCTRVEFDQFLLSLVKEHAGTEIFTNTRPQKFIAGNHTDTELFQNQAKATLKALILLKSAFETKENKSGMLCEQGIFPFISKFKLLTSDASCIRLYSFYYIVKSKIVAKADAYFLYKIGESGFPFSFHSP